MASSAVLVSQSLFPCLENGQEAASLLGVLMSTGPELFKASRGQAWAPGALPPHPPPPASAWDRLQPPMLWAWGVGVGGDLELLRRNSIQHLPSIYLPRSMA